MSTSNGNETDTNTTVDNVEQKPYSRPKRFYRADREIPKLNPVKDPAPIEPTPESEVLTPEVVIKSKTDNSGRELPPKTSTVGRPRSTRYTRYCEVCGKARKFYQYDINRGKGLYCSRQCGQRGRMLTKGHTYNRICTVCLLPFRTSNEMMLQCCVEHEYTAANLTTYKPSDIATHPTRKRKMARYQSKIAKQLGISKPWEANDKSTNNAKSDT